MNEPKKRARTAEASQPRKDGRKQLLVYLNPDLLKEVKIRAVQQDRSAYEVVEDALRAQFGKTNG